MELIEEKVVKTSERLVLKETLVNLVSTTDNCSLFQSKSGHDEVNILDVVQTFLDVLDIGMLMRRHEPLSARASVTRKR